MARLSERQRKRVEQIKPKYVEMAQQNTDVFMRGYAEGYKEAMRTMYPDAETFVAEEPKAADMVLTLEAIKEAVG